ncbi:MAG: UDP-N-acetylmuramoyl-L-alanyl-D-glutamate--2,6-diaminopimelate ligase [Clostridia bacterium]|nr:UDP-N-acetylmuramoyl-L-alanyl-D-glutamate--2,6-diaminopimelate ligase [Clostridia bacterium]
MKLVDLLDGIEYSGCADMEVKGIACDSRLVEDGYVFVCIKGYETDGHLYAGKAAEKGASVLLVQDDVDVDIPAVKVEDTRRIFALLCSRFYGNPTREFKLIGITGTNGKTTVTYLIKTILENEGQKVGLIGTNQNMIGEKVFKTERTTPDSFELNRLFRLMADEKCDTVIMEVSSHSLYLDRVYGCEFDVGAFTNLTQDHLDFHKTMDNYLDAKSILFTMCKKGVINKDDAASEKLLAKAKCPCITYGTDSLCDVKAGNVKLGAENVEFTIDGSFFSLAIPGKFSVYNALTAISVCRALGLSDDKIAQGLLCAKGVKGRAQVVDLGLDFTVLIDYAHTPDGIENILNTAKGFAKGRVIILFGCGGDRDNKKRPIMGEIASSLADFCIITSDNPRTENPSEIIRQILEGVKGENYKVIENRREAIEYAVNIACKDDVVILAGKGHETYQTIGKENFHFDEEEILFEVKDKMREKK